MGTLVALKGFMADTRAYREAEEWVRAYGLPQLFSGHHFTKRRLQVGVKSDGQPAVHEFDAVSDDRSVVASVKCGSGRTNGGKPPTGQSRDAYKEAYFLSRIKAPRRLLVLPDPGLFNAFKRESDGKLPHGVELTTVRVPDEIWSRVLAARRKAIDELSPRAPAPP